MSRLNRFWLLDFVLLLNISTASSFLSFLSQRPLKPNIVSLAPSENNFSSPSEVLKNGKFFKFICGASFEDSIDIRNMALIYTLAGVDCIDCAADGAVVNAVHEGVNAAMEISASQGVNICRPWVMISVNDDNRDPHFRKASFNPELCPFNCPRPCEKVCPAQAIAFPNEDSDSRHETHRMELYLKDSPKGGVILDRCYGCGRCLDVCPPRIIEAVTYIRKPLDIFPLLDVVDAIEIHTKGDLDAFKNLWTEIGDNVSHTVKAVSVSFPDLGSDMENSLKVWHSLIGNKNLVRIWQTDGRPMSGDVGDGAAYASVAFSKRVLEISREVLREGSDFVQLAGGTNDTTISRLKSAGLLCTMNNNGNYVSGAAFGGYARKIVGNWLQQLPSGCIKVEDDFRIFRGAFKAASKLVSEYKSS